MKYKTDELTGELLDAAVATALEMKTGIRNSMTGVPIFKTYQTGGLDCGPSESDCGDDFEPSSRWAHGGPIIEREQITVTLDDPKGKNWCAIVGAWMSHDLVARGQFFAGPTPLVAAMRAFVFSRHGETVDL